VKYAVLHIEEGKAIGNITYSNIVLQNANISSLVTCGNSARGHRSSELQSTKCLCEIEEQVKATRVQLPCTHHEVKYGKYRPSSNYSKLGARWRWSQYNAPAASPQRKSPPAVHWTGRLSRPQRRHGSLGEYKNLFAPPGSRTLYRAARNLVTVPITLSRLLWRSDKHLKDTLLHCTWLFPIPRKLGWGTLRSTTTIPHKQLCKTVPIFTTNIYSICLSENNNTNWRADRVPRTILW
jgi:hypothetical protein